MARPDPLADLAPTLEEVLRDAAPLLVGSPVEAEPREGQLPLEAADLLEEPSGNLFAWTQNVAMGAAPGDARRPPFLVLSTQGGVRGEDGFPVALGYHTGHWEVGLLVRAAAETFRERGALPFAAAVSDPCDGRTQGTDGMMDSLAYRNDAAIVLRRLIRSLPTRRGVMAIGTCDKGLPAMLLALAGAADLPGIVVPGGVTLPARGAEDAGTVQSMGARFAHGLVDVDYAATMGCQACGSAGGGCQFLGTAATAQVVAEALGLTLPHAALAPSGTPVWLDLARRSALALLRLAAQAIVVRDLVTDAAIRNAMLVHAAFGGSTNLILHLPATARAAGLRAPTVDDWIGASRATPRLVDALPNGPRNHPTVLVHLAGGVPEVMLHLRDIGALDLDTRTASGQALGDDLAWWEASDERGAGRERLRQAGVDPEDVIAPPHTARARGLAPTLVFPLGNLAPEGSIVKATAIDASSVEGDVFRHRGPVRVFASGVDAMRAVKARDADALRPGDMLVLAGVGPLGTGMAEIASITIALKLLPWGSQITVLTDGRFSGVSTGPCIGHVSPEALAGGPIGRLRDGDLVEVVVDRAGLVGSVDLVGIAGEPCTPAEAERVLAERDLHPALAAHPRLPDDTRLWALLQSASGGVWGGCAYDVDQIEALLAAGLQARERIAGGGEPSTAA